MGFFSEFKRGLKRESKDDRMFEAAGIQVVCSHCGAAEFRRSRGLSVVACALPPASPSYSIGGAGGSATMLVCKRCGHVEWFDGELNEIE